MRSSARILGVGVVLVAGLHAMDVGAYCRTTTSNVPTDFDPFVSGCWMQGVPVYWSNACVSYSLTANGSKQFPLATLESAVHAAFDAWTTASCGSFSYWNDRPSISVEEFPPTAVETVGYNVNGPNVNAIIFQDDAWPYDDSSNTLGLTTLTFNVSTGEILDGDIEINSHDQTFSLGAIGPSGYDLEYLLAHEAGRFLGLANSDDLNAIEYAEYEQGTAFTALNADDIAGVCIIYPPDGTRSTSMGNTPAVSCDPTPRGGFEGAEAGTITDGCSVGPAPWRDSRVPAASTVAGMSAVALIVRRRRRKK